MNTNKVNIEMLEKLAIERTKSILNSSNSISKKSILIDLLKNGQYSRIELPGKAMVHYYQDVLKQMPETIEDADKTIISFKNSLDTLISNYNNPDKVANDPEMCGTKLERLLGDSKLTIK